MDDSKSRERNHLRGPSSGIRLIDEDTQIDGAVELDSDTTRLFKPRKIRTSVKHNSNDSRIGTVVDRRYRVVRQLAVGSTGVVYLAHRICLDRSVAIKFLEMSAAKHTTFVSLFEREARAMGRLFHPNCISVTDYGIADVPYIVMDLVDGHTLKTLTDRGPIEPSRAIHIVAQLLAALAHAHTRGIIHRDIKPGNIMLSEVTGTLDFVRVFDFGMAKLLDVQHSKVDDPDIVLGTPQYMSPEHIRNQELDARSDLFSVGIVLYESLTGHKPFLVKDLTDILRMHQNLPSSINHGLTSKSFSDELEAVVRRSLAVEITARFQNAIEFRDALLAVPEARPSTPATVSNQRRLGEEPSPFDSTKQSLGKIKAAGQTIPWILIAVLSGLLAVNIYFWMLNRSNATDGPSASRVDGSRTTTPREAMDERVMDRSVQATNPPEQPNKPRVSVAAPVVSTSTDRAAPEKPLEVAEESESPLDQSRPMELKRILAQIKAGDREEALANLIVLKDQRPDNAYLYLLLGNLYSEMRQWSRAIESYRSAVAKDRGYRSHRLLVGNTVLAINDDVAYPEAKDLIEKEIGTEAISKLLPLAQRRAVPRLQQRAQELLDRLSSQ